MATESRRSQQNEQELARTSPSVEISASDQLLGKTEPSTTRHTRERSLDLLLDTEITDVMFHFDTIVSELERSTLQPSPAPEVSTGNLPRLELERSPPEPSPTPEVPAGILPQSKEPKELTDKESTAKPVIPEVSNKADPVEPAISKESTPGVLGGSTEHEPVTAKVNISERKKQFLGSTQPQPRESSPIRDSDALSRAGKVRSLIAQLQTSHISPPTSPPPPPLRTDRKQRSQSPSLLVRHTDLLPGVEELLNERRRSYTPPPVRRRIQSPFLVSQDMGKETKAPLEPRESRATRKSPVREPVPLPVSSAAIPSLPSHVTLDTTIPLDNKEPPEASLNSDIGLAETDMKEVETTAVVPTLGLQKAMDEETPAVISEPPLRQKAMDEETPTVISEPPVLQKAMNEETPTVISKPSVLQPSGLIELPQQPVTLTRSRVRIAVPERLSETEGELLSPEVRVPMNSILDPESPLEHTEPGSKDLKEPMVQEGSTELLLSPPEVGAHMYRIRSASDVTQMKRPGQAYFTRTGRISTRPVHQGILPGEEDESKVCIHVHSYPVTLYVQSFSTYECFSNKTVHPPFLPVRWLVL